MAWNDASELFVGSNGQAYFAPVGTTLPARGTDPTAALNAAFVGAGLLTTDGITPSFGSEVVDFEAWQSLDPVRRERTGAPKSVGFQLQQWNESNIPFAFGGGTFQDHGGGNYSYIFPEGDDPLEERSLVIDVQDGDVNQRFVFARGTVTDAVDFQFQRGATAILPVNFRVLRPEDEGPSAYLLTDAPGSAAGS